jgi:hypothetical protein
MADGEIRASTPVIPEVGTKERRESSAQSRFRSSAIWFGGIV